MLAIVPLLVTAVVATADTLRPVPPWTENHLLTATLSSNIESFAQGVRGAPDKMVYDFAAKEFKSRSKWHEYGVRAGAVLGVVNEATPVWWMAAWDSTVRCNVIALSGCYPNQPQTNTAWKIEIRHEDTWRELDRGVGGWYDNGRFLWRAGVGEEIEIDAFRVNVFSKDASTPIQSIHFRGEPGISWVVAEAPDFDVRLNVSRRRVRLGESVRFSGEVVHGTVQTWLWDFGDGHTANGALQEHIFAKPGTYDIGLQFADNTHQAALTTSVIVASPVQARIAPLKHQARVGESIRFDGSLSDGPVSTYTWSFDDRESTRGKLIDHKFDKAGIYKVALSVSDETYSHSSTALVRVHDDDTTLIPQVILDTDQKNEQDDQYYLGYSLFSDLDILGVNSVHHGGGQEAENYSEILNIINLTQQSGLSEDSVPMVFHGADARLKVPYSGLWSDTIPTDSPAARAILAAARGASPEHPVWVVPVGPGTNVASAILLAREQGMDLEGRIRVMWLGGSNKAITSEFNGNNDPWSMFVVAQSGVDLWIVPAPVGARVRIDKRTESDRYANHPLGQYLEKITPARDKPLYDAATISAIIGMHLQANWVKEIEYVTQNGPDEGYTWVHTDTPTNIKIIREIDQEAMKTDLFNTLKGRPQHLQKAALEQEAEYEPPIPPTHNDVYYGPYSRNLMDIWLAESDGPTPVLISIHGGAFRHGVKGVSNVLLRECLASGISVVSITYRFSGTDIAPAQFDDAARALQFIRHNAQEWNLDPKRIASTGGSAGAGLSLWLGFHDDMADPNSEDPILRQSTRLTCVAVNQGQSSYDPRFIRELIPENETYKISALEELFGTPLDDLGSLSQEKIALIEETSALPHLSKDDTVPVLMTYDNTMDTPVSDTSIGIHHPRFGMYLKQEMDKLGLHCEVHTGFEKGNPERSKRMFAFVKRYLLGDSR
jgi:PKD repeat protein